ncbi:hypothetical protein TNCV_3877781 [Trichonephila clavipes]|uniref:Uncharacterized protein n=1 Tax=Trichonephila clavipes TaxID=2585209 RepID=A0A8X6SWE9_TRICX|nr:hypothetical protein TNCV_3877781 [Trichonephila clavipes]
MILLKKATNLWGLVENLSNFMKTVPSFLRRAICVTLENRDLGQNIAFLVSLAHLQMEVGAISQSLLLYFCCLLFSTVHLPSEDGTNSKELKTVLCERSLLCFVIVNILYALLLGYAETPDCKRLAVDNSFSIFLKFFMLLINS